MSHDSGRSVTRRDVLKGAAFAGAALVAGPVLGMPPTREPAKRLRFGIIGVGGKGWSGMEEAARFGDIVALCDIDARELAKGILQHPRATAFADYRVMLEAMKDQLDAVVISTPDHHHGPAAARAMKLGLHCYCEKPLTRSISEARLLAKIAREKRLATQMGNQSTSHSPMRKAAAAIALGEFGHVEEIHLWTDRAGNWWKQGHKRPPKANPPKEVAFDLWLGPSPERDYGEGYHPFAWRGWWDFGTGALGDMGCHIFNMPFMALGCADPIAVQAQTSGHDHDVFPEWAIVHYEFAAKDGRPAYTLHWYDGGKRPDPALAREFTYGENGVIVVCEKAVIFSPDSNNMDFRVAGGRSIPEVAIEESPGHMAEFARAALGGPPSRSNFPDYAAKLTETVLLGNLAIWADGPRVEWDARRMRVPGKPEFDALLRPTLRPGWL